jgi:hypothetical protein
MPAILGLIATLLALWFGTAQSPAAELPWGSPAEGEPFRAALAGVDAQWQITLAPAGGSRRLPAAALVAWGTPRDLKHGPHFVVLSDGGVLAAEVTQVGKEGVVAESSVFGAVKVPLAALAGIVFQAPPEPLKRDLLLDRIVAAVGSTDRVLLVNGDEIAGTVRGIRNRKVDVQSTLGAVAVELARVRAVVYNPSLVRRGEAKGLRAWTGFSDGSRLVATQLVVDEKQARVSLPGGPTLAAPAADLVFLQPLGGRAVYLSDLRARYVHLPYLSLSWPYRPDRGVLGGILHSGGRPYLKGIGVHSTSRLSYALAEPYRAFEAELAIDDETAGRGSVRFRVFVDGEVKYTSPTVRGGSPPLPIRVDLSGAKQLDLVVDFADRADEGDHADWLNARLLR